MNQSWVSLTFLQILSQETSKASYLPVGKVSEEVLHLGLLKEGVHPWMSSSEFGASPPEGPICDPFRNPSQPQDSEVGVTSYVSFKSENSSLFYCSFQSKH